MSWVTDLITMHCPAQVIFEKIGNIAEVGTGSSDRKNASDGGEYPFYVRSKDVLRIGSFEFDEEAILIPGEGGIGDIFHYVQGKYALHQRAYRIKFNTDRVDTKFAYYFFSANFKRFIMAKAVSATVTSIRKPMITDFRIPVPPLEVQREIVRILDHFSALEAELEAELEARQRQYAVYRDQLLTFADREVRWSTLGDISLKVSSGGTPLVSRADYYEDGTIPWLRTQEVRFLDVWDTEMQITEKAVRETSAQWIPENCVIVAISGASAGRSAINKIPLTTDQHCCNFEIDPLQANYRYVFHWVSAHYEGIKALGRGARSDLNAGLIKSVRIAIPALSEQERIVQILDNFDALVNDLTIGLPAELAARRKQYEYYRDRLLTFEEAPA